MNGFTRKGTELNTETPLSAGTYRLEPYLQDRAVIYTLLDDAAGQNVCSALYGLASEEPAVGGKALPESAIVQAVVPGGDGTIYVGTDRGLFRQTQDKILPVLLPGGVNITSKLSDPDIRALALDNGGLWIGTRYGLNYYTPQGLQTYTEADGLPIPEITHLAATLDGALWIGTPQGAIRFREGRWRYYAGRRWLPDDQVIGLHGEASGDCWIRTRTGLSHITHISMTFPQKAVHYERIIAERHNRNGYVTDCRLLQPGDPDSFLYEASDNDGLWTSLYLCAECFRYAVTGEAEARELARRSLAALLDLVYITDIPGFPARAQIRVGERVLQSDPGPNWYPSPVRPGVLYKNDTSSDELDGHYLAWYLFSVLVADEEERFAIAAVCRAVTNHILDHHYTLVGPTGKRTTWGVWAPEVLNVDPKWAAERGLNSLSMLSHLKVAIHLCGDARFADAYRSLILQHGYALNTVGQKMLPPAAENNHSDDELAACAYYPLLMLETDPALRRLYLFSLERTHAVLYPERSPFYNFLYGALTGKFYGIEAAVEWLQDAPWDLTRWTCRNSRRADIRLDPETGRFGELQALYPLSPRERRVTKWNSNPYALDGGEDGHGEEDGTFWLLPYWMGRHHRIIVEKEPERGEKTATSETL